MAHDGRLPGISGRFGRLGRSYAGTMRESWEAIWEAWEALGRFEAPTGGPSVLIYSGWRPGTTKAQHRISPELVWHGIIESETASTEIRPAGPAEGQKGRALPRDPHTPRPPE